MLRKELCMRFGAIVSSKRRQLRLTREKLAELVDISVVYCRNIELGKHCINWVIWAKLCVVLELDINSVIEDHIKPELNEIGKIYGMKF